MKTGVQKVKPCGWARAWWVCRRLPYLALCRGLTYLAGGDMKHNWQA